MKFRKSVILLLTMALCLGLSGCKRHVFTVYQEGNYISETLVDQFTEETGIKVKLVTGDRTPQAFEPTLFEDTSTQTAEELTQEALMGDESTDPADETEEAVPETLVEMLETSHNASIERAKEKAEKKGKDFDLSEVKYDAPEYDVVFTDGITLGELVEKELLADLTTLEMENRNVVDEEYRSLAYDATGNHTVTTMWGYLGLLVNVELAEVQLTKWDALWDETYAGQVVMPSLSQDSAAVAMLAQGLPVAEMNKENLEAAFDKLAEQKTLVSEYHNRDAFLLMENELGALYPCYSGDALEMMSENPSLIFMIPQGGTVRSTLGYGIAADSQLSEEAAKFVDFMCRPENLAKNAVYCRHAVTSSEALEKMDENWSKNPVLYPDSSLLEGTPILSTLPEELRRLCAQRWERLVG